MALLLVVVFHPGLQSSPHRRRRLEFSCSQSSTAWPWLFLSQSTAASLYHRPTASTCAANVAGSKRPARDATSSPLSTSRTARALSSDVGLPSAGSAPTT